MTVMTWARSYIPPSRAAGIIVFTAFVDSIGTGVYLAGASLFLAQHAGLTATQIGIGLSVAGLAAFLSKVPLGSLADRLGTRNTLVIVQALRGFAFIGLAFVDGFTAFLVVSIVMGILEGPVSPLTQAVVAAAVPDKDRVRTLAIVRSARNVAFSFGALLASPLIALGTDWAYKGLMLVNALSFFIAAAMMARVPQQRPARVVKKVSPLASLSSLRDGSYLSLAAVCGAMSFYTTVLMVGIPLWAIAEADIEPSFIPLLIAVNTVLTVVLQVPMSHIASRRNGGRLSLHLAAASLAAAFLLLALLPALPSAWAIAVAAIAVVALTVGETTHTAGEWELSLKYADESRRAQYLSTFNLGEAAQTIVGPAILTAALLPSGSVGWIAAAVLMGVCAVLVSLFVARLERRSQNEDALTEPKEKRGGR